MVGAYKTYLYRMLRNVEGTMAFTWAISMTVVITAIGASFDFSQLSNARNKSQAIADSVALTAAIYVNTNGAPPTSNSDGYVHGQTYAAEDIGYDYNGLVKDVNVTVRYDQDKREAVVEVTGVTVPAFMKAFGYSDLEFTSRSVVKYSGEDITTPASIALILDNSGSMGWYDLPADRQGRNPPGSAPRIDGLKTTVKGFMRDLNEIAGAQNQSGDRILRTGMIPYSSNIIGYRQVPMRWGTIANGNINAMRAGGGTNPLQAMRRAHTWLRNDEGVHENEHGNDNPLKFAIFMTDGVNSSRRIDTQTISTCNAMKRDGVKVYTIGYSLNQGRYITRFYRGRPRYTWINRSTQNRVYNFLRQCASEDSFFTAVGGNSLRQAFEEIGKDIAEDTLRIAM